MKDNTMHVAWVYTKTIFKTWFQYRANTILSPLAVFLREATGIIVIYFTLLLDVQVVFIDQFLLQKL